MANKQTAVEWFYDQITRTYWDYMTSEEQNLLFEQAKQMEKEQMIEFANTYGTRVCNHDYENGEQYYNETFKQQDK